MNTTAGDNSSKCELFLVNSVSAPLPAVWHTSALHTYSMTATQQLSFETTTPQLTLWVHGRGWWLNNITITAMQFTGHCKTVINQCMHYIYVYKILCCHVQGAYYTWRYIVLQYTKNEPFRCYWWKSIKLKWEENSSRLSKIVLKWWNSANISVSRQMLQ